MIYDICGEKAIKYNLMAKLPFEYFVLNDLIEKVFYFRGETKKLKLGNFLLERFFKFQR